VTAREQQLEPLVLDRRLIHLFLDRLRDLEQARLRSERAIAPDPVDRSVARRRDEPAERVRGCPLARPALGRDRKRLLRGFLGEVEVAEEADQARDDAAPFAAEDLLDDR
jgi:hypothetical protein